jgi:hypothetical protein
VVRVEAGSVVRVASGSVVPTDASDIAPAARGDGVRGARRRAGRATTVAGDRPRPVPLPRAMTGLVAAGLLVVGLVAPAAASPHVGDGPDVPDLMAAAPPYVTYTYTVETRGQVLADPAAFAADAAAILGDARSWTLGGSVVFERVGSGGDFALVLASPSAVAAAAEVCSPDYSCRVGDDVLINDRNWREATPAWRDAGGPLWQYRQYLVNHEVGHFLGFGHFDCPAAGARAPVMQQQSIALEGCVPNGWPLEWEREQLGERLGVPVHADWYFPDVLRGDTHRGAIHAVVDAGIAEGHADGWYRPEVAVRRDQMASFVTRARDLATEQPPPFPDVPPDVTHAAAIAAAAEAGIVEGFPDGRFQPGATITRAQMASYLARAYGLEASAPAPFDDVRPDDVHAAAIAAVAEAGIAEGFGDGRFGPRESVTRAQMASFLARAEGLG